ncbi:MAG: type II toxin-antitoxin system RelE/ParE family toxin [Colwellia sp.]|nr:type II toxin-antitoxin system RelE/ParE family toxin [Colwellia sp.]
MPMPNYRLSPLAESDLYNIISSTIESWGNEQAKVYAQTIDVALVKLAQYPDFGRQRDELYKNARSFPVEKHIVFYQVSDAGIDVARILHQRMDQSKHF